MALRSKIIATAEANSISHLHFDLILGEFILYTNTSFWIFLMGLVKLIIAQKTTDRIEAGAVIVGSGFVLTFTSPFFKDQYLSALEVIQTMNEKHEAEAAGRPIDAAEAKVEPKAEAKAETEPETEGGKSKEDSESIDNKSSPRIGHYESKALLDIKEELEAGHAEPTTNGTNEPTDVA